MSHISAFWWLFFNILSTAILAFFSMSEMAAVSFNKLRLQYYFNKGHKRAIWLNYLLQNPTRLFGTTLIVINLTMVIGSECSREFHSAIGLSPDLAPLSQIILVVVFGELAPIFAARKYPEHVAMITVPVVYFTARMMAPFLKIIDLISIFSNYLFGGKSVDTDFYINQEELRRLLEDQDDTVSYSNPEEDLNTLTSAIFKLNSKDAKQIMKPLSQFVSLSSNATVLEMRKLLAKTKQRFIPIYYKEVTNIIGIATPKNLLRAQDNKKLRDFHRPPWFITEQTKVLPLLKQFKSNSQNVAIVLNNSGKSVGIINVDDIIEEIFGKVNVSKEEVAKVIIDRTFPANFSLAEFEKQFGYKLDEDLSLTLVELMTKHLGHIPERGDSIYIEPFEFVVKESSMREVKQISVTSKTF